MQRPGDQEHHIVNHVSVAIAVRVSSLREDTRGRIRDIVEELGQWLDCVASNVVELVDEDLGSFICDGGGGNREGLVCEKIAIVSSGQLSSEI